MKSILLINFCILLIHYDFCLKSSPLLSDFDKKVDHKLYEQKYNKKVENLENSFKYAYIRRYPSFFLQDCNKDPILSMKNTSLILERISIVSQDHTLFEVMNLSKAELLYIEIMRDGLLSQPLIFSDSELKIESLQIKWTDEVSSKLNSIVRTEKFASTAVIKSDFCDAVHCGEGTFIHEGPLLSLELSDCNFFNITLVNEKKNDKKEKSFENEINKTFCNYLRIEGSKFVGIENPYYGCITTTDRIISSFTHNCSYLKCFADSITARASYGSGDNEFNDTTFNVNGNGKGGALYFYDSANAYINRCIFNECNDTQNKSYWGDADNLNCRGGAVWSECGVFVCTYTNCSKCDAFEGDNFFSLWNGNKRVLDYCLFSVAKSIRYGGVNIEKGPSGTLVHRCIFENGTSDTYGGGAGLMISYVNNELTISECTFQHNYAGYHAGALHFFLQDSKVGSDILCIYLKFNNNTSNKGQGSDVMFNMQFEEKHFSTDKFIMCVSNSGEHRFSRCSDYNYDSTICNASVDYDDYLPSYPANKLYVDGSDSASKDEWHCGDINDTDKKFKCKTLDFALTQWHPLFQDKIYVENDEAAEASCLNVSFRKVEVDMTSLPSDESGRVIVRLKNSDIAEGSLINMSTGNFRIKGNFALNNFKLLIGKDDNDNIPFHLSTLDSTGSVLNINNCTITTKFDKVTKSFTEKMLYVDKGLLNLNNDNFEEINLDGACVISFSLGSDCEYSFTSVLFKNIVRNSGNGAVIEQNVSDDQTFEFSGVTFDGCQSPSGNGGVIYVEVGGNGKVVIGKEGILTEFKNYSALRGGMIYINSTSESVSVEVSNITFDKKDTSSDEIHGEYLFVEAGANVKISSFVKEEKLPIIFDDGVDFNDTAGIKEGLTIAVPLKLLFYTFPEYPVVDMESVTIADYCGYEEYACKVLFSAFEQITMGTKKACIRNKYIVSESLTFNSTNGYEIKGKDNSNITAEGGCYFDVTVNTAFNSIPVCIPDSLTGHDSLFSVSANKLTMNIVEFDISSSWGGYTLWKVSGGGSINLTSVNFEPTNIINTGESLLLFDESGSGGIDISGCHISNLNKTSGNGAAVSCTIGTSQHITIQNTVFTSCNSSEGNGGAIYLKLTFFKNCDFTGSTFINCDAKRGKGYFIEGEGLNTIAHHLDGKGLTKDTNALEAVGVKPVNLSLFIPLPILLREVPAVLYVEKDVETIPEYCGYVDYSCKTFALAFDRRNDNNKVVKIIGAYSESTVVNFNDTEYDISNNDENSNITAEGGCYFDVTVNTAFNSIPVCIPDSLTGHDSLFSVSANKLTMNIVEFDISSSWGGYTLWKVSGGGSINLTSVNFEPTNIINTGESLLLFDESGSGGIDISGCHISNLNKTSGNGAAVSCTIGTSQHITIQNTVFTSCSSSTGNGGALYLELNSCDQIPFSETSFVNCNAVKGKNYFILCSDLNKTAVSLSSCKTVLNSSSNLEDAVGITATDSTDYIPLVIFLWTLEDYLFVEEGSQSISDYCGFENYKCGTLEDAFGRESNKNNNVYIVNSYLLNTSIVFNDIGYNLENKTEDLKIKIKDTCRLSVSVNVEFTGLGFNFPESLTGAANTALFSVSSNTLSIINSIITLYSASTPSSLGYSIWNLNGGSINLDGVLFNSSNNIDLSSSILTDSGSGSITVSNSQFQNMILATGDGSVIKATIEQGGKIKLIDSAFTNCESTSGKGGAVWLCLKLEDQADFTETTFTNCNAQFGKNYFILSSKLNETSRNLNGKGLSPTTGFDLAMGSDDGVSAAVPLVLYLRDYPDELMVNYSDGIDNKLCGFSDYTCKNIKQAFSNQYGKASSVKVLDVLTVNEVLDMNSVNYSVKGEKSASLTITGDASFMMSVTSSFTTLTFTVNSLSTNALFTSTGGNLTVDSCGFSISSNIANSLYNFGGQTLSLNTLTFAPSSNVASFGTGKSMIVITNGSANMNHCTFNHLNFSDGNVLKSSSCSSISLESSYFMDIKLTGTGAEENNIILVEGCNGNSNINNTRFANINCSNGSIIKTLSSAFSFKLTNFTNIDIKGTGSIGNSLITVKSLIQLTNFSDILFTIINCSNGNLINAESSSVSFSNSNFTNIQIGNSSAGGNLIMVSSSSQSSSFSKTLFSTIQCTSGSIMKISNSFCTITNTNFTSLNLAGSSSDGNNVVLIDGTSVADSSLTGALFEHIECADGCIIKSNSGKGVTLKSSNFTSITVSKSGSSDKGIIFINNNAGVEKISACLFNEASCSDGCIIKSSSAGDFSLESSNFTTITIPSTGRTAQSDILNINSGNNECRISSISFNNINCSGGCIVNSLSKGCLTVENSNFTTINITTVASISSVQNNVILVSNVNGNESISQCIFSTINCSDGCIFKSLSDKGVSITNNQFSTIRMSGSVADMNNVIMFSDNSELSDISYNKFDNIDCVSGSVVKFSKEGNTIIKHCNFTSVSAASVNGSCLNIPIGDNSNVKNVESCNFSSCNVTSASCGGGGVYCNVGNSESFNIRQCKFTSCKAPSDASSKGRGGGIYLDLSKNNANYLITSSTFSDMDAYYGKHVCLCSLDLNLSITASKCSYLTFDKDKLDNDIGFCSASSLFTPTDPVYIALFLLNREDNVYIGKKDNNVKLCGFKEFPCATVSFVMENITQTSSGYFRSVGDSDNLTFVINGNEAETGGQINLSDKEITIKGATTSTSMKSGSSSYLNGNENSLQSNQNSYYSLMISDAGGKESLIFCNRTARIDNLNLKIASGLNANTKYIFCINDIGISGDVSSSTTPIFRLNNIVITPNETSSDVNQIMFNIIKGVLGLNSVNIGAINLGSNPFLKIDSSLSFLNLVSLEFDSVNKKGGCMFSLTNDASCLLQKLKIDYIYFLDAVQDNVSVVEALNAKSISFEACEVKSINSGTKHGTFMNGIMNADCSVNIVDSTFTSIGSRLTNGIVGGGCFFLTLNDNGSTEFKNSSFSVCTVSELEDEGKQGRGGGIYLYLSDNSTNSYQFSDLNFSNNKAYRGKDIYIRAKNLETAATQDKFNFNLPMDEEERKNILYGIDGEAYKDEVNIIELWRYKSSSVYVSGSGLDAAMCGSASVPCRTIDYAYGHLYGVPQFIFLKKKSSEDDIEAGICNSVNISDLTLASMSSYILMDLDVNISEKENQKEIVLLNNEKTSKIERIIFMINKKDASSVIIGSTDGFLSLTECEFDRHQSLSEDEYIKYVILKVTGGSVVANNISLNGISLDNSAFVFSDVCTNISINAMDVEKAHFNTGNLLNIAVSSSSCKSIDIKKITGKELSVSKESVIHININGASGANEGTMEIKLKSIALDGIEQENGASASGMVIESNMADKVKVNAEDIKIENCEGSGALINGSCCLFRNVELNSVLAIFTGVIDEGRTLEFTDETRDDVICKWSGSFVYFDKATVDISDLEVENCSDGAIGISEGSSVTLAKVLFRNNNPNIVNYPSVRRNIICNSGDGESTLNLTSVKGGDGANDNPSLWILNNNCVVGGVIEEYKSYLFLPVINTMSFENVEGKNNLYNIDIIGEMLIPCDLNFNICIAIDSSNSDSESETKTSVKRNEEDESSDGNKRFPLVITEYINETNIKATVDVGEYTLYSNMNITIDSPFTNEGRRYSPEFAGLPVDPNGGRTDYIGHTSQSGFTSIIPWYFIAFIITAVLALIVLIIVLILFLRSKKKEKQVETLNPDQIEKANGESEGDGAISSEYARPNSNECSSRTSLLLGSSITKMGGDNFEGMNLSGTDLHGDVLNDEGEGDSFSSSDNLLKKRSLAAGVGIAGAAGSAAYLPEYESSNGKLPLLLAGSGSSDKFLVEAMNCEKPYNMVYVDSRDSLYNRIHSPSQLPPDFNSSDSSGAEGGEGSSSSQNNNEEGMGENDLSRLPLKQREVIAARTVFWVANGSQHILSSGQTNSVLEHLTSHNIIFGEDGTVFLGNNPSSFGGDTISAHSEAQRWRAPELLRPQSQGKGDSTPLVIEMKEENVSSESIVFSLGMVLYEMVMTRLPYEGIDDAAAAQKIMAGENPVFEGEAEMTQLAKISERCLSSTPSNRPTLDELKEELLQLLPEHDIESKEK